MSINGKNTALLTLLLALQVLGCRRKAPVPEQSGEPAAPAVSATGPLVLTPWNEVERGQAKLFGLEMEASLNGGRSRELVKRLDLAAAIDRAFLGLNLAGSPFAIAYHAQMMGLGQASSANPFRIFESGHTTYLGLRNQAGKDSVRLRVIYRAGGCAFLDCYLRFDAKGQPHIADFYNYGTALSLEGNYRVAVLSTLPATDKTLADQLSGSDNPEVRGTVRNFFQSVKDKDGYTARKLYPDLPLGMLQSKDIFMTLLRAIGPSKDPDASMETLEEGRKHFPDAGLDFLLLDLYRQKSLYPEIDQCLERIILKLEPDPYLIFLRGLYQDRASHPEAALRYAEQAAALDPTLKIAQQLRLGAALRVPDYAAACRALTSIQQQFHEKFQITPALGPEYQAFGKSAEYLKWLAERPSS